MEADSALELDDADPGTRLDRMLGDDERLARAAHVGLLSLIAIEDALHQCLGAKSLYLVEDHTLRALLHDACSREAADEEIRRGLILLNHADLIFRFTCARKFRVQDRRMKQVRVNSWGQWHARDRRLARRYPDVGPTVDCAVRAMLRERHAVYARLAHLLARPITPSVAALLEDLSCDVSLRILS